MCFQLSIISAESNGIIIGDKCLDSQASPLVKLKSQARESKNCLWHSKIELQNAAGLLTNTKEFKMNISEFWMNIQIGITGQ